MAEEENEHRRMLIDNFVEKFGNHIPLVRRQRLRGYIQRSPLWQVRPLGIEAVRRQARQMERTQAASISRRPSRRPDAGIRKLLGDLAVAEVGHQRRRPKRSLRNACPAMCARRRTTVPTAG